MKISKKALSVLIWIAVLLIIWELSAYILKDVIKDPLSAKKLPGLGQIAASFKDNAPELMRQAGITLSYAAKGFAIGAVIGAALAVIMSLSGICEKMTLPYLLCSQMIPVLGLAPIVFGLFKDIAASRVVISAYITFFPVAVNLLSGIKSAEEDLRSMMRSFAAGKLKLYTKLYIPGSLPWLFSGLKISAPMAVTAAILVDTLSAKDGIGYVIVFTLYGGGTAGQFWPAVIIASLMGLMSFFVIALAEYILIAGRRKGEDKEWRKE